MSSLLGNSQWAEESIYDDEYTSEESSFVDPWDDDYVREGYEPYEDL